MQNVSNEFNLPLIRIYGVEGHGKGEVDHVGGIAKVYARDEINRGTIFTNASGIVNSLICKFGANSDPKYDIREIDVQELTAIRSKRNRMVFKTVHGSDSFHVMVFKPNASTFRASPRLCICDECKADYGSCSLFSEYELCVHELRDIPLRSDVPPPPEVVGEEEVDGFVTPGSIIAVAADDPNVTFFFLKVVDVNQSSPEIKTDDYGKQVPPGNIYVSGYFLEKNVIGRKSTSYKLNTSRIAYAYKESLVYPYVDFEVKGDNYILHNEEYTDVLIWIEKYGLVHIQ